jgi:hypothetical protein
VIRSALLVVVALACMAAAPGPDTYVVSPKASEATKTAIAEGRPPEHGYPVIDNVHWTSTTVKPGSTLEADVLTSSNIDYVEGRYKDWNFQFTQLGLGHFHLTYKVPVLPPFLIGRWKIDVIARSIDGVETRRSYEFSYTYF